MKKFLILFYLIYASASYSQVGVGTTTPDNSAALDVDATDKGILLPRVSLTDVTNTTSPVNTPATGLMVWNTNAGTTGGSGIGFYFFNGTIWKKIDTVANTLDQAYDYGGSGAGRTIIADTNPVRINGTDGLLVTGTFGSGAVTEVSGAGTRAFFNPRKAAFRTGNVDTTQWDDANIGNYSFAAGHNPIASGYASMAVNEDTQATGSNSSAFGKTTIASGQNSTAMGNTSTASGLNAFATGSNSIASGDNSFTSGNNTQARSYAEVVVGSFNTLSTPTSTTTFNTADKAFVVGIGASAAGRKDGLKVWKDGRVTINDAYTLPNVDGTSGQVLSTSGAGVVSWTNETGIVSNPLYAANTSYSLVSAAAIDLPFFETSVLPTLYNSTAKIVIKVIIRYTSASGVNEFRLRAHDGTTQSLPIQFTDIWTTTATQTGGVVESQWVNWNAGTVPYEMHLQGKTTGAMAIQNAYLLIKSQ